jgi:hypothetical protein
MSNFYLAGPFFSPKQVEVVETLKALLEKYGHTVFSPMDECLCPPDADDKRAIKKCDAILVITDGKDMGTIFEAGAAYQLQLSREDDQTEPRIKPMIYYFAQTLGDKPFNLMLAQSGQGFFKSYEELDQFLQTGIATRFAGQIQ